MNTMSRVLLMVLLAQMAILIGMVVNASVPLWTGKAIYLKTEPVDPRSLLRGNYARLRYDISSIPTSEFTHSSRLRHGEIVYITLRDAGDAWVFSKAGLVKPASEMFIRGRVRNPSADKVTQDIEYGIEAFFAPQVDAQALELRLRDAARASVMVASSGKAALEAVEPNPVE